MSIENLKHKWHKSFNKSVNYIESCLTPKYPNDQDSVNFSILANWLLETKHNPYDFMPEGLCEYQSNPFQTEYVLHMLHHAFMDDGEVSFVKMKIEGDVKRIFMMFVWKNEDCFDDLCKKENASMIKSYISGREMQRRVMLGMQEKHPEKTFNIRPPITENDIVFEAHRDPITFIKELEEFKIAEEKRHEEIDEKMKKIRGNKP